MSVNGVGFELYGKNYGSDDNVTSGSDEIKSIFDKINDVTNKKTESESEAQTKETELAQTNEDQQAQVQDISNNLAQIESQYSAAVTAATSAQTAATTAATNASNLEAAAAALPAEIQQGTNEDGSPKKVPNPAKAAAEAAAKRARTEADKLQKKADALIKDANEMQSTFTELQEALNDIETKQEDTEEKDVELEALNEQIQEFDTEISDLNAQLESAKSKQEAQNSGSNGDAQATETDTTGEPKYNPVIDNNGYTTKQEITQPDGTVITVTEDENGNTIIQSTDPTTGISTTNTISISNDGDCTFNTKSTDSYGNQILNQTVAPNEETLTEIGSNTKVVTDSQGNITGYETTDSATGIKTTVDNTTGETTYTDEDGNQLSISEMQEKKLTYDRTNANRDAIIDHDRKNAINGLANEESITGNQLDIDKYYDQYHNQYDATDEASFQEYKNVVADAITNDIAEYAGINMSEVNENRYTELKSVYETIANNIGYEVDTTQIPDDMSPDQYYINQVNQELAYRSWDDALLDNDYVDLTGVEKAQQTQETEETQETQETGETEETQESDTTQETSTEETAKTLSSADLKNKVNELRNAFACDSNTDVKNILTDNSLTSQDVVDIMTSYNSESEKKKLPSLIKTIDSSISSSADKNEITQKLAKCLNDVAKSEISSGKQYSAVKTICKELYNATAGKWGGTADEFVENMIDTAEPEVMAAVLDEYNSVTGSELYKDIENDFSGNTEKSLKNAMSAKYTEAKGTEYTGWDDGKLSIQDKQASFNDGVTEEIRTQASDLLNNVKEHPVVTLGVTAAAVGAAVVIGGPAVMVLGAIGIGSGLITIGKAVAKGAKASHDAKNATNDASAKDAYKEMGAATTDGAGGAAQVVAGAMGVKKGINMNEAAKAAKTAATWEYNDAFLNGTDVTPDEEIKAVADIADDAAKAAADSADDAAKAAADSADDAAKASQAASDGAKTATDSADDAAKASQTANDTTKNTNSTASSAANTEIHAEQFENWEKSIRKFAFKASDIKDYADDSSAKTNIRNLISDTVEKFVSNESNPKLTELYQNFKDNPSRATFSKIFKHVARTYHTDLAPSSGSSNSAISLFSQMNEYVKYLYD